MSFFDENKDSLFRNEQLYINLVKLRNASTNLRKYLNTPMNITSCCRTIRKHKDIYAKKGIKNVRYGSAHLKLLAIDFTTRNLQKTKQIILSSYNSSDEVNTKFVYQRINSIYPDMKEIEKNAIIKTLDSFYWESFKVTHNWCHAQLRETNNRFFYP